MTETERIDLLEELVKLGPVHFEEFINVPAVAYRYIRSFTIPGQWQNGKTIRELIDTANDFHTGKCNWKKESWG